MSGWLDALNTINHIVNHKITTMFVATGVFVTGQTSPSVKSLNEIPITEIFQHDLSALAWTMLIASGWIIVQFLNFAGVFRGIGWVFRWLRARKN